MPQGVHAQTFGTVREVLAQDGFITRAVEFGDFIQPNAALAALAQGIAMA